MEEQTIQIDDHHIRVTNWNKILWPESGFTKGDLMEYFLKAAPFLLPHLKDRPLTVVRFPSGIQTKGFYQKNCPQSAPEFVQTVTVSSYPSKPEKAINYILVQNTATLLWLANQAAIELHTWLSLHTKPEHPDWIVFDIDPGTDTDFDDARETAFLVRQILEELALASFPKVSGATGIHIYVPIAAKYPYATTSKFVNDIGKLLESAFPDKITTERLIKNRHGKVYIDHLQNLPGKTVAAPYSPRPLPKATISTPISWQELETVYPDDFHLGNILERLEHKGHDLFAPLFNKEQLLDTALAALGAPVV